MRMADRAGDILVVDDDPEIVELFVEFLSDEGYRVRTAMDADAALQAIAGRVPALLLLDILLPSQSGIDLLHNTTRINPLLMAILRHLYANLVTKLLALKWRASCYTPWGGCLNTSSDSV